ncbi:MAG: MmcQ/YjbR family DNA-binding protein [Bacteroidetes bacterium]|nr:MmcQ/YjbR family DNA-binding protein [Bacteroidota bacterium]
MNIGTFQSYCLAKKGVTEEFPFDNSTLVYKVMGKMFALTGVDEFKSVNLKCEPEIGAQLREEYSSVLPGYHMNKKHWITVLMDGSISDKNLKQWIDASYQLVVKSLPKSEQKELESL